MNKQNPTDISETDPIEGLAPDLSDKNIIIVRDSIRGKGGGDRTIESFARILDAPIYTLRETTLIDSYDDLVVNEISESSSPLTRLVHRAGLSRLLELPAIYTYQNWEPPRSTDVVVTVGRHAQHVIHHLSQHRIHFFFHHRDGCGI
jgi:hypothetical protein